MATVTLSTNDRHYIPGYYHTETIATGATGNDLIIPPLKSGRVVTITLIAGSNTGKFQATTSTYDAVTAGTAIWFDLPLSAQTGTVADSIISPIAALRGVSISGEIKIEVKI